MDEIGKNYNLINFLIKECNFKSYLEIGVRGFKTFDMVECDDKVCVDPQPQGERNGNGVRTFIKTSNQYFEELKKTNKKFDLIFIDGDHSFSQVKKDLGYALRHISENGLIVMHDMDPPDRHFQGNGLLPRGWKKHPMGECWRAMVERRIIQSDIDVITIQFGDIETGLTIVKKGSDKSLQKFSKEINHWSDAPGDYWDFLSKHREELLNVYPLETFNKKIKNFINTKNELIPDWALVGSPLERRKKYESLFK